MTYIVKHLSNGTTGVYDTIRGCYPIAGDELRAAGVSRIEGTAPNGWFKKSESAEAERIAAELNDYYGYAEGSEAKVTRPKAKSKAAIEDDSLATVGAALIADQAGA